MRKLKLESLQVESFDTAPAARERGTMYAHEDTLQTYDVEACGDTQYFDCSYGCSMNTDCEAGCGETGFDCVPA